MWRVFTYSSRCSVKHFRQETKKKNTQKENNNKRNNFDEKEFCVHGARHQTHLFHCFYIYKFIYLFASDSDLKTRNVWMPRRICVFPSSMLPALALHMHGAGPIGGLTFFHLSCGFWCSSFIIFVKCEKCIHKQLQCKHSHTFTHFHDPKNSVSFRF